MTGTELLNWLTASRMTQTEFAQRAGVYQPRVAEAIAKGDIELSAYWTPRFEQAMDQVDVEDRERLGGTP